MDHTLDFGYSILITKTAAEVSQAGKLIPLPDSSVIPANDRHPGSEPSMGRTSARRTLV